MTNSEMKSAFDRGWDFSIPELPFKVVHKKEYCILSVFGADTRREILDAFSFEYEKWHGYKVHTKTLDKWLSIRMLILREIGEQKNIKITAFSMGGAICQLARIDLQKGGYKIMEAVLMNSYKSVKNYEYKTYRNQGDMSSLWPFWIREIVQPKKIKSPYPWFRFIKNHFYIREFILNGGVL